jgi:hypothetical protein
MPHICVAKFGSSQKNIPTFLASILDGIYTLGIPHTVRYSYQLKHTVLIFKREDRDYHTFHFEVLSTRSTHSRCDLSAAHLRVFLPYSSYFFSQFKLPRFYPNTGTADRIDTLRGWPLVSFPVVKAS